MIGIKVNILAWEDGTGRTSCASTKLGVGLQAPLSDSAAGWLLLSALDDQVLGEIIGELTGEASPAGEYSRSKLESRTRDCRVAGCAIGPAGFGSSAQLIARPLLPEVCSQPLVIGFVLGRDASADTDRLLNLLDNAIRRNLIEAMPADAGERPLARAA